MAVTGYPKPTFQWRRDNEKLVNSTAASATLVLRHVTEADVGVYTCDISNDVGSTKTKSIQVELRNTKPVIKTQPGSVSLTVGEPLHLSVEGVAAVCCCYSARCSLCVRVCVSLM